MYTLLQGFGKPVGNGHAWEEKDLSNEILSNLFLDYQGVYLQLHESVLDQDEYLNFEDYRNETMYDTRTLGQWLTDQGNRNLRATPGTASLKTHPMYCYDIFCVDFLPTVGNTGYEPSNEIPEVDRTDILLTRDKTDYNNVGKNCLFTVGGYFHRHEYGSPGVYIVGGNKTTLRSGSQEIGMLDFSRIGEIEIQSITEDQLLPPSSMLPYRESVYCALPRTLQEGETLGLVIGGYFHLLDNTYSILSETSAIIHVARMQYIQRYFRSRDYLDLSSMAIEMIGPGKTGVIDAAKLKQNDTIKAWVTHPNSFWVYIKSDNLTVVQDTLPRPHSPGEYFLGVAPEGALRVDYGEMPSFVQVYEKPIWALKSKWEQRKNTLMETGMYKASRTVELLDTPYLAKTYEGSFPTLFKVRRTELILTPAS